VLLAPASAEARSGNRAQAPISDTGHGLRGSHGIMLDEAVALVNMCSLTSEEPHAWAPGDWSIGAECDSVVLAAARQRLPPGEAS
jgi:hypothetical protein